MKRLSFALHFPGQILLLSLFTLTGIALESYCDASIGGCLNENNVDAKVERTKKELETQKWMDEDEVDALCTKHGLPLEYWNNDEGKLLCKKCVVEEKYARLELIDDAVHLIKEDLQQRVKTSTDQIEADLAVMNGIYVELTKRLRKLKDFELKVEFLIHDFEEYIEQVLFAKGNRLHALTDVDNVVERINTIKSHLDISVIVGSRNILDPLHQPIEVPITDGSKSLLSNIACSFEDPTGDLERIQEFPNNDWYNVVRAALVYVWAPKLLFCEFYGHLDAAGIAKLPPTIWLLGLAIGSAADAKAVSGLRPWKKLQWLDVSVSCSVAVHDLRPLPSGPTTTLHFPGLTGARVVRVRPAVEALVGDRGFFHLALPSCQLTADGTSRLARLLAGVNMGIVYIEASGPWRPGVEERKNVKAEFGNAGCISVKWDMEMMYY